MKMRLLWILFVLSLCLTGCSVKKEEGSWNPLDYEEQEDIISIKDMTDVVREMTDHAENITIYKVRYKSDDCEVVSYLGIPNQCLLQKEAYPCIIYNRGGNRAFGEISPKTIAEATTSFNCIVFASQYRGVDGGTGTEEFGGADVNDVLKLIDLCEAFTFVDMDRLYMLGFSRGGMMTYQSIREDDRIKKAAVVSGITDAFMSYEERTDMHQIYQTLVGDTPDKLPEAYKKRSATYWADELKCPVLIIHSKQDWRVSHAQAEKMVQCLEDAGMDYKFISREGDAHGLQGVDDILAIMDWFELINRENQGT